MTRVILLLFCCFFSAGMLDSKEPVYNDFEKNPHLSQGMRKKIKPYILPYNHPARVFLDSQCHNGRVILNPTAFELAGFVTLHTKSRSYIRVARHPLIPGFLFKVYLDSEKREKNRKAGWEWLVARCKGAKQIRHAIRKQRSKFFQAPRKWLYPLPPEPSPVISDEYTRQPAILVVEDMDLVPEEENYNFWKNQIEPRHLAELFGIITLAKGSSYRPDNICLSKNGKLSFIDTEYPNQIADYGSLQPYLSDEMRAFWDELRVIIDH